MQYIACGVVLLVALAGCSKAAKQPHAQKGVLDAGSWDFERHGILRLDGEWEFYGGKLYAPRDFDSNAHIADRAVYIRVPGFWNRDKNGGAKYATYGYATYRLNVQLDPANKCRYINIPDPNSAYRLWVNGELIAEAGKVGRTAQEEKPHLQPVLKIFGDSTHLEVVVQVSNFFNHKPGIWQSISIGEEVQMLRERDISFILSMCLVGAFIILAVYNLFIFFLRRNEFSALWFSMLSLGFGLRTFVIGDRPLLSLFPGLDVGTMYRIQYESFLGACVFLTLFVYSLFEKEFPRPVLIIITVASIVELGVIVAAPSAVYTSALPVFEAKAFLECFFCLYVVIRAAMHKRRRALLLCCLLLILFFTGVNDTLYVSGVINTGYTMHYGAFFILLAQAYIVATRISGAYFKFSNLTVELNAANLNLEQKVADRTRELESEKTKADDLLLNILPAETAHELKATGNSEPRSYNMASVMFVDMVGFTLVSEQIGAELLVAEIDQCFSAFDEIVEDCGIEKIKTIGDAYLCAGGLPIANETHAHDIINAAMKIKEFMERRKNDKDKLGELSFRIRIGVSSGPVVAGIVGNRKFSYDIWGNTVNMAARMEQNSEAGKINISETTYQLVKDKFSCVRREDIEVSGEGNVNMYFVE